MNEVEVKGVNLARETGGMALGRGQLKAVLSFYLFMIQRVPWAGLALMFEQSPDDKGVCTSCRRFRGGWISPLTPSSCGGIANIITLPVIISGKSRPTAGSLNGGEIPQREGEDANR